MVDRKDLYNIPHEVATKLDAVLPQINEILKARPDFPHEEWHTKGVIQHSVYAARVLDSDNDEIDLVRKVAETHDEGYKLVRRGVIAPGDHHYGSFLIAKERYGDSAVAMGALMHNSDVISEEYPFAYRIVRDIDRLHLLGWGGALRVAHYFGYEMFRGADVQTKNKKASKIFEQRTPNEEKAETEHRINYCFPATAYDQVISTDFERKAKIYAWMHVFPALYAKGKLDEFATLFYERFFLWSEGESYYKYPGNHSVPAGEEYSSDNIIYTIEPINEIIQRIFGAIIFNSYDVESSIKAWKKLHVDGTLADRKTELNWAQETYWKP